MAQTSLTVSGIVAAALDLLDHKGLLAFSVRDLANRLNVYPAAIDWHVASRNHLLALMVAQVLGTLRQTAR